MWGLLTGALASAGVPAIVDAKKKHKGGAQAEGKKKHKRGFFCLCVDGNPANCVTVRKKAKQQRKLKKKFPNSHKGACELPPPIETCDNRACVIGSDTCQGLSDLCDCRNPRSVAAGDDGACNEDIGAICNHQYCRLGLPIDKDECRQEFGSPCRCQSTGDRLNEKPPIGQCGTSGGGGGGGGGGPCRKGYKRCGGICIPEDLCCTNGHVGCPKDETCIGGSCCDDKLVCGDTCLSAPCDASKCETCDTTIGQCVSKCTDPDTPVCDGNGTCVECIRDGDCDEADCEKCSNNTCVSTCSGETPVCNGSGACVCNASSCNGGCCDDASGACVDYADQSDDTCGPSGLCGTCDTDNCYHCNTTDGTCDFACTGNTPVCNGSGTCVECTKDGECDEADCEVCSGNQCVSKCTDPTKPICDGNGHCVECTKDGECDSGEICCSNHCITCNTPPNTECWNAEGTCANGQCSYTPKAKNTPCNDGDPCTQNDVCDGNGTCAGTPITCPTGEHCSGGVCECGNTGTSCGTGFTCCSGECVDTQKDPNNCNGCGNTCPTGERCSGGVCKCGNKASCGAGLTCCNGDCVNTQTDPDNCNACGNGCPTSTCRRTTCTDGVCGLQKLDNQKGPNCFSSGKVCCNGICVNGSAGQCPICCQNRSDCPSGNNCVGSGACGQAGLDACVATGKCCRPQ
ncbi:MAG: hypothetical protein IT338_10820 [Thermomicrobiales bacterium]|nr:hypothetical protein [Thermomicrobiales bacterium]